MHKPQLWLGGSFNPVHYGHLRLVRELAKKLNAVVYLLPSGKSPFHKELAPAGHRLKMLELAVQEFPEIFIDKRELLRDGVSYTVDTLTEIRNESGRSNNISFVIGDDALAKLTRWKDYTKIFDYANLVVLERESISLPPELHNLLQPRVTNKQQWYDSNHGAVFFFKNKLLDISSTLIRQLVIKQDWHKLKNLMPLSVINYIREEGLFS